ncbi:hypothetical protein [Vreelandella aquamarina]|uniref:hypothetical protein n=1 Tax=Vreelandella aquamarina TaxID=77097 RepID=UPI001D18882D|nr:hypothetical protein [Halomonas meridiana]MCC4288532.1 hypothetical protein [Halomonas meridiana]
MANLKASTFASRELAEKYHLSLIDLAAAEARHTDVSQELIYQQKVAEATAGGGELLIAEAAALGIDAETVLNGVLKNHQQRQQHIHRIELDRITAKAAVRNAATAAAMHRIYHEFKEAL